MNKPVLDNDGLKESGENTSSRTSGQDAESAEHRDKRRALTSEAGVVSEEQAPLEYPTALPFPEIFIDGVGSSMMASDESPPFDNGESSALPTDEFSTLNEARSSKLPPDEGSRYPLRRTEGQVSAVVSNLSAGRPVSSSVPTWTSTWSRRNTGEASRYSLHQGHSRVSNERSAAHGRLEINRYFDFVAKESDLARILKGFDLVAKLKESDLVLNPNSNYCIMECGFCTRWMRSKADVMEKHFFGKRVKICSEAPHDVRRDAQRIQAERCEENKRRAAKKPQSDNGDMTDKNIARYVSQVLKIRRGLRQTEQDMIETIQEVVQAGRKVSGSSAGSDVNGYAQSGGSIMTLQDSTKLEKFFADFADVKESVRKNEESIRKNEESIFELKRCMGLLNIKDKEIQCARP